MLCLNADHFAHECRIRDFFARNLADHRPFECVLETEPGYATSLLRADMRTVHRRNTLREWEFKVFANHKALGQILTYLAIARREANFDRQILGVLAAFEFSNEVRVANQVLNLGIELLEIPRWMRQGGAIPEPSTAAMVVAIPSVNS